MSGKSPELFKIGDKVFTHGLKTVDYNGKVGTIAGGYNIKKGRWPVKLSGATKGLKPENLRLLKKEVLCYDEDESGNGLLDSGGRQQPVRCIRTTISKNSILKPNMGPGKSIFINYLKVECELEPFDRSCPGERVNSSTSLSNISVPFRLTEFFSEKDSKGNHVLRLDCVMNSIVFELAKSKPQMNFFIIQQVFRQIEQREGITLCSNHSEFEQKYFGDRKHGHHMSVRKHLASGENFEKGGEKSIANTQEIRLPFEKVDEYQIKEGRTRRLSCSKPKKKSIRLVIEEVEDEDHTTQTKAIGKREYLDLTSLAKTSTNRDIKSSTKKPPACQKTSILNENLSPTKSLITDISSIGTNSQTEEISSSKSLHTNKIRSKDEGSNVVMKEISTIRNRKVNLLDEIREFEDGKKKSDMVKLADIQFINVSKRETKNTKVDKKNGRKNKKVVGPKKATKRKSVAKKVNPLFKVVKKSKGYKVIVLLDDALCGKDINATWERKTKELQVESSGFFLSVCLAEDLTDPKWGNEDPIAEFSTKLRALKVYFLHK